MHYFKINEKQNFFRRRFLASPSSLILLRACKLTCPYSETQQCSLQFQVIGIYAKIMELIII